VETVAGPSGALMTRRATSIDFTVFRCGRSDTPRLPSRFLSRVIFRSIRSASSTRLGVSTTSRVAIAATDVEGSNVVRSMSLVSKFEIHLVANS
jgi:hypothetical protein